MAYRTMTAEDRAAAGHNLIIHGCIQAAGGYSRVAREFGLSLAGPRVWTRTGNVPTKYRERLCELTGGAFRPAMLGKRKAKKENREAFHGQAAH